MGRGLAGVTVAGWLGNILSYLLLLAAARRLGTADYAELVALFNLLLIGSIPSFALQAVAARRMAVGHADGLWQVGLSIGLGAALLIALASPLLVAFLHLPGAAGPLLVAVSMPGTALQGLCQGVVQGEQRFVGLAATTFVGIAGKSLAGLIGLLLAGTATVAMAAIAIGVSGAAAASVLALPELRRRSGDSRGLGPLFIECGHASHAYGVFLLLSVIDVLLVRHVLSTSAAAVYSAGSVLTKATLWFPQSVANVLFASLADTDRHHRVFGRAVSAIAGLAAAITVGSWLLGGVVGAIVGGNRYPDLAHNVWLFALLGGCLSVLQFTLVAGLAVRSVRVTALIWLSVGCEAVGVLLLFGDHPSVRSVVGLVAANNLVIAGCAVLLRLAPGHRALRPEPATGNRAVG